MIKTTSIILQELAEYASPADKLTRMVKNGEYIPIARGLYETDKTVPGYLLAESIYGPSYLSFEFALSYHGMIPEAVYAYTCATFEKKKRKTYTNYFGTFYYRDVPSAAYPYGIDVVDESSLFAGTLHAVLGRSWHSRIKGRDLYDYVFYLSRETTANLKHLRARLIQSGHISESEDFSLDIVKKMLLERFDKMDYEQAKLDVEPFIQNKTSLNIWSADFFKSITGDLQGV